MQGQKKYDIIENKSKPKHHRADAIKETTRRDRTDSEEDFYLLSLLQGSLLRKALPLLGLWCAQHAASQSHRTY